MHSCSCTVCQHKSQNGSSTGNVCIGQTPYTLASTRICDWHGRIMTCIQGPVIVCSMCAFAYDACIGYTMRPNPFCLMNYGMQTSSYAVCVMQCLQQGVQHLVRSLLRRQSLAAEKLMETNVTAPLQSCQHKVCLSVAYDAQHMHPCMCMSRKPAHAASLWCEMMMMLTNRPTAVKNKKKSSLISQSKRENTEASHSTIPNKTENKPKPRVALLEANTLGSKPPALQGRHLPVQTFSLLHHIAEDHMHLPASWPSDESTMCSVATALESVPSDMCGM